MKRVTLYADIEATLQENDNRWMAPDIIAMSVNNRRLFRKPVGEKPMVTASTIRACIFHPERRGRFEREGDFFRLVRRYAGGTKLEL